MKNNPFTVKYKANENKNIERLKIEAAPIFNECGITIDFLN